jgi:hypothetical protein
MRKALLVCLATTTGFVDSSVSAQSTNYEGAPRTYSTADVLAVLGKRQTPTVPPELLFDVDATAEVGTKIRCGEMGLNVDVQDVAKKVAELPRVLATQGSALLSALPMLTVCYASPSLCAELKNLNFRMDEHLKGLTDVCTSADSYIAAQSTSEGVKKAAANRGWQQCVRERQAHNAPLSSAVQYCNEHASPMLYTDIAKAWVADTVTPAPQKILASILTASGQMTDSMGDEKYRFLTAVLGELKMDENGKLLPVFPARPLTASSLSKNLRATGVGLACDQARLTQAVAGTTSTHARPEARFYEQHLLDVVKESLEPVDVTNLFSLDPPDRDLVCNALGRSLGKEAVRRSADDGEATTTTALQNQALPETVRKMYEARAEQSFRALRSQSASTEVRSIPELKGIITRMAELQRATRRDIARTITKGQMDMDELSHIECDSDQTCN